MEIDKPTRIDITTIVAIDHTSLFYRVCSVCEKTISDDSIVSCQHCKRSNSFKRLFRLLMSIATDTKVFPVIMFDRAAKVLFGCSADEFFDFAKTHPYAEMAAARVMEGEMLTVTLSKPKNSNAQHLRVASVVPLQTNYQSVIETLREMYQVRGASSLMSSNHEKSGETL